MGLHGGMDRPFNRPRHGPHDTLERHGALPIFQNSELVIDGTVAPYPTLPPELVGSNPMHNKKIKTTLITELRPYKRNARTHSRVQIGQIADSIKHFGFTNPILIDQRNTIVAGHGRVEAAKLLGMDKVPTLTLEGLSNQKIRAYILADNKLAENAGWDPELLKLELQELDGLDLDFDLTVTGFDTPELDLILGSTLDSANDNLDIPLIPTSGSSVSRLSDLWHIGEHRLYCGDALDPVSYRELLGKAKAQMVFTDPPYNVPINGHVCGLGGIKHREFTMASGEMSQDEFRNFLSSVTEQLASHSKDGSIHYLCMDWRHIGSLLVAASPHYSELKNICVWNKSNGGMGSLYRSKHEMIAVYKAGSKPHINNIDLGRHGRNRTNVWDYAGITSISNDRNEELAMHPTVKPVSLVKDAILDCSKRNGIVLDAFTGSGTTLLAAEGTGRRGYGIEIDPSYIDTAIHRLREKTGLIATLGKGGATFEEIAAARGIELQGSDK